MRRKFNPFFSLILFVIVVLGFVLISAGKSAAQDECFISIIKEAEGGGNTSFGFTATTVEGVFPFSL